MAELPYMPFYPSDYMADAHHLTTAEHGAYFLLIISYWMRGEALPDSDARLAAITRMTPREWKKARPTLEEFFMVDGRLWVHKRIELDLKQARAKVEQARAAGAASAAARKRNGRSSARSNGRSSARSNGRATISELRNNPLTPLDRSTKDAPAPLDGRASSSDGEAKTIGDVLEARKKGQR